MNAEYKREVKALGQNLKNGDLTLDEYREYVIALDRRYRDAVIEAAKMIHDSQSG